MATTLLLRVSFTLILFSALLFLTHTPKSNTVYCKCINTYSKSIYHDVVTSGRFPLVEMLQPTVGNVKESTEVEAPTVVVNVTTASPTVQIPPSPKLMNTRDLFLESDRLCVNGSSFLASSQRLQNMTACYDDFYEAHSRFQKKFKSKRNSYLYNEKRIYHRMVPPKPVINESCNSIKGTAGNAISLLAMLSFFERNKDSLFVPCHDNRTFSHCQEFFLMQYSSRDGICSSFAPQPCCSRGWF